MSLTTPFNTKLARFLLEYSYHMNGTLFGFFFLSIFWNLFQNFKNFQILNQSATLESYFESRRRRGFPLYVDVLSSLYIVLWLGFSPIFLSRISAFYKFLFVCYMLYSTYRFAQALRKVHTQADNDKEEDQMQQIEEELNIMDEMMDVRPFLMLEPISLVILESVCFLLSALLLIRGW